MRLIIGGDGLLGRALVARCRSAQPESWLATTRRDYMADVGALKLDLSAAPETWELPDSVQQAWILAGLTSLDACERDPVAARTINAEHTVRLARMLIARGAHVVFPSTDRVFDGKQPNRKPGDPTKATTVYGALKAETEQRLLGLGNATILRLGKVLSLEHGILKAWLAQLTTDAVLTPYSDAKIAPVSLILAAEALWRLADKQPGGIHHLTARTEVSYAMLANWLAASFGGTVAPVSAPHNHGFPDHCALDCASLTAATGIKPPLFRETVNDLVAPRAQLVAA